MENGINDFEEMWPSGVSAEPGADRAASAIDALKPGAFKDLAMS